MNVPVTGRPLRLCLLGEGWPPDRAGGLNRYVADLLTVLRIAGVDATAVVVGPVASAPPGITVVSDATQPVIARLRAFAAAADDAAKHADVIDTHFALYGALHVVAGRTRRTPHVVHFHGPWADEGAHTGGQRPLATWVKRRAERLVYRRAAAVVTLSGAFRQLAIERYRVSPWRLRVIPPSVDLDRFVPGDAGTTRTRWGVGADTQLVVCVRRLVPRTGVEDLLRAWAMLPAATDRLLLVAGDGPERSSLLALTDDLGVTSTVRFLGPLTEADLVALYQAADLTVVPSRMLEGFGLVVLEALACGTPVVVTDSGGLPEAVAGLQPDTVVPVGRADLLASRIEDARTGARPLPTAAACRAHAEGFSAAALTSAHVDLYERAASRCPDRRIRVVFLSHCAKLSGAEIALLRLIAALPDVAPHVILGEDGPLIDRLHAAGVSVEVLPLGSAAGHLGRESVRPGRLPLATTGQTALYMLRLSVRLRSLRPDVVHANSLKACLYGAPAARAAGIPVVWHARDRVAADYLPEPAVRLVRAASHLVPQAIVANSEATMATVARPRGDRRAVVVGDPFRRTRPVSPSPDGALRVGVVGRLAEWKGQHVVLEAFAQAFPTGAQRCVVVGAALFGEDEYATGLLGLADRLGIADRVEFRGFVDDVEAEIDSLHVVVHASVVPEPFGQVVVEAMAAGRCVVATSVGGPAEIVRNDQNGLLYPPGEVATLAEILRRLDASPADRERLATGAIARAAAFDPTIVGPAVLDVYRHLTRTR